MPWHGFKQKKENTVSAISKVYGCNAGIELAETRLSSVKRSQAVRIYYGTKTAVETVRQPEFDCQATYRASVVSQFRRHFWCHYKLFWRPEYVCLNSIESPPTQSQCCKRKLIDIALTVIHILLRETQEIAPEQKAFEKVHS